MKERESPEHSEVPDFDTIFNDHYKMVTAAIRLTVGPISEWEDLVQTTFLEVFRSLDKFEGRSSLSTWIYRIAIRTGVQHKRSLARKKWLRLFQTPEKAEEYMGPHPVASLESREALEKLDRLLAGLTEAKRSVFILSEVMGCSNTEIGEILDLNPNTVRSRLHAARTELLGFYAMETP